MEYQITENEYQIVPNVKIKHQNVKIKYTKWQKIKYQKQKSIKYQKNNFETNGLPYSIFIAINNAACISYHKSLLMAPYRTRKVTIIRSYLSMDAYNYNE